MLSALILTERGYPAVQLAPQPVCQRFIRPGPLVLRSVLLRFPTPTTDRDRTVSRRSEPSSRATLIGEQPNPWNVPDRLVCLSVKPAFATALSARLPSALSGPWEASVTLLEATTPVKLPTKRCPSHEVRPQTSEGWYFTNDSTATCVSASQSPTYPTHPMSKISVKL